MSAGDEILIVEDDDDNRLLIMKILSHFGFKNESVVTGKEALEYCEKRQPILILLDLSLPDITGQEVAKTLRTKKEFQSVPIIACTALATTSLDTLSVYGFTDHIIKPFQPIELINIVKKYLAGSAG